MCVITYAKILIWCVIAAFVIAFLAAIIDPNDDLLIGIIVAAMITSIGFITTLYNTRCYNWLNKPRCVKNRTPDYHNEALI